MGFLGVMKNKFVITKHLRYFQMHILNKSFISMCTSGEQTYKANIEGERGPDIGAEGEVKLVRNIQL